MYGVYSPLGHNRYLYTSVTIFNLLLFLICQLIFNLEGNWIFNKLTNKPYIILNVIFMFHSIWHLKSSLGSPYSVQSELNPTAENKNELSTEKHWIYVFLSLLLLFKCLEKSGGWGSAEESTAVMVSPWLDRYTPPQFSLTVHPSKEEGEQRKSLKGWNKDREITHQLLLWEADSA